MRSVVRPRNRMNVACYTERNRSSRSDRSDVRSCGSFDRCRERARRTTRTIRTIRTSPNRSVKKLIIAIDGPSGAGKGTIARTIAESLGYRHIDTGAMYRAVGWKANAEGIRLDDEAAVAALAHRRRHRRRGRRRVDRRSRRDARDSHAGDRQGGRRGGAAAARARGARGASARVGEAGGVVMEGRDIGTVVFPECRRQDLPRRVSRGTGAPARQRSGAHRRPGGTGGRGRVDRRARRADTTRTVSPLTMAPGAVHIDTTDMPIDASSRR